MMPTAGDEITAPYGSRPLAHDAEEPRAGRTTPGMRPMSPRLVTTPFTTPLHRTSSPPLAALVMAVAASGMLLQQDPEAEDFHEFMAHFMDVLDGFHQVPEAPQFFEYASVHTLAARGPRTPSSHHRRTPSPPGCGDAGAPAGRRPHPSPRPMASCD